MESKNKVFTGFAVADAAKKSALEAFCDGRLASGKRPYNLDRAVDFKAQEAEHVAAKEAAKLPEMERSLIAEFAERCKMGFAEYGPVFLGKRNWGKELKEEALDGLFYALMAAKTMEKYGDLIKALEEASDDELSMDACSPDPLKQAAYIVKQLSSELTKAGEFLASEKRISANLAETVRDLRGYDLAYLKKALEDEREAKRRAEVIYEANIAELAEIRKAHAC